MKYFELLKTGIDVTPLLHSLQLNPGLWGRNTLRTTAADSPHREVQDIWLRFLGTPPENRNIGSVDCHEVVPYEAWYWLPAARPIVFDLMRLVGGTRLGPVLITKLPRGAAIAAHSDGPHALYYNRYHVSLKSGEGSRFTCDDETVEMKAGEAWYFNNHEVHSVFNGSADDRIHLIADIRI